MNINAIFNTMLESFTRRFNAWSDKWKISGLETSWSKQHGYVLRGKASRPPKHSDLFSGRRKHEKFFVKTFRNRRGLEKFLAFDLGPKILLKKIILKKIIRSPDA